MGSSSPGCRSLEKVSVQLDQRLLVSLFPFVFAVLPLSVQKAFHFVVIGEERRLRRDSGAISSTVDTDDEAVDVCCGLDAVRVGFREWTEESAEFVRSFNVSFGNGWP